MLTLDTEIKFNKESRSLYEWVVHFHNPEKQTLLLRFIIHLMSIDVPFKSFIYGWMNADNIVNHGVIGLWHNPQRLLNEIIGYIQNVAL